MCHIFKLVYLRCFAPHRGLHPLNPFDLELYCVIAIFLTKRGDSPHLQIFAPGLTGHAYTRICTRTHTCAGPPAFSGTRAHAHADAHTGTHVQVRLHMQTHTQARMRRLKIRVGGNSHAGALELTFFCKCVITMNKTSIYNSKNDYYYKKIVYKCLKGFKNKRNGM